MKVKTLKIIDIECPKCGKTNVKYHAKGMCRNCYMFQYLKAWRKKKMLSTGA